MTSEEKAIGAAICAFLAHQLISTFGVIIGSGAAVFEAVNVLKLLVPLKSLRPSWLLTGIPGFPLQTASALLLGFSLGMKRPQNSMLWVWLVPWFFLVIAAIAIDAAQSAPFSYFFGCGCLVVRHCFTQAAITLPALTSTAYAAGATVARFKRFQQV